ADWPKGLTKEPSFTQFDANFFASPADQASETASNAFLIPASSPTRGAAFAFFTAGAAVAGASAATGAAAFSSWAKTGAANSINNPIPASNFLVIFTLLLKFPASKVFDTDRGPGRKRYYPWGLLGRQRVGPFFPLPPGLYSADPDWRKLLEKISIIFDLRFPRFPVSFLCLACFFHRDV